MHNKGFVSIAVIVVGIIIACGIGGYVLFKKQNFPRSNQTEDAKNSEAPRINSERQ